MIKLMRLSLIKLGFKIIKYNINNVIQNKNGIITLGYLLLIKSLIDNLLFNNKTPVNIKKIGTPIRPKELYNNAISPFKLKLFQLADI